MTHFQFEGRAFDPAARLLLPLISRVGPQVSRAFCNPGT